MQLSLPRRRQDAHNMMAAMLICHQTVFLSLRDSLVQTSHALPLLQKQAGLAVCEDMRSMFMS
jgi:hypothetical protein